MTLMVHAGWDTPGPDDGADQLCRTWERPATRSADDQAKGQRRPMGTRWQSSDTPGMASSSRTRGGRSGARVASRCCPYEDYLLHATDVWVAQLGVPVAVDTWNQRGIDTTGLSRGRRKHPARRDPPVRHRRGQQRRALRPGRVLDHDGGSRRACSTRRSRSDRRAGRRTRLMLYLHGGLNDERGVAKRIVAFRDVLPRERDLPAAHHVGVRALPNRCTGFSTICSPTWTSGPARFRNGCASCARA